MIKVFKTKSFSQWAKKEKVTDDALKSVIQEITEGLIDADLGGGLLKKRVARSGQGKRGGYRTLLAFKKKDRAIFIFGFSKKDRENIDREEREIYKKLCQFYLGATLSQLRRLCKNNKLFEVMYEKT